MVINRVEEHPRPEPPGTPAVLRYQPHPVQWITTHFRVGPMVLTSIARVWAPGDSLRCRLCRECSADSHLGVCLVTVDRYVPRNRAALFCSQGMEVVDLPSGARV